MHSFATSTRLIARGQAITQIELPSTGRGPSPAISVRLGTSLATAPPSSNVFGIDSIAKLGGPVVSLTLSSPPLRGPSGRFRIPAAVTKHWRSARDCRTPWAVEAHWGAHHAPPSAGGGVAPRPFGIPVPKNAGMAATALAQSHGEDPVMAWSGYPDPCPPDRPPILLDPPSSWRSTAARGPCRGRSHRWPVVQYPTTPGPERQRGVVVASVPAHHWRATLEDGRTAWLYREQDRWACMAGGPVSVAEVVCRTSSS